MVCSGREETALCLTLASIFPRDMLPLRVFCYDSQPSEGHVGKTAPQRKASSQKKVEQMLNIQGQLDDMSQLILMNC